MTTGQRYRDVGRFGRWADSYNESRLQRLVFAPLQEFTLHEAAAAQPAPRAILDVGCGTGLLLHRPRACSLKPRSPASTRPPR